MSYDTPLGQAQRLSESESEDQDTSGLLAYTPVCTGSACLLLGESSLSLEAEDNFQKHTTGLIALPNRYEVQFVDISSTLFETLSLLRIETRRLMQNKPAWLSTTSFEPVLLKNLVRLQSGSDSVPHKASSASCFCGLSSVSKRLY